VWKIKLKHILAELNEAYVLGCIKHYESMSQNPWTKEHDRLEAVLKIGNDVDIKNAIDVFEKNIRALIKRYQS